jgi:ABC-type Mn2+/Zn2+ transport system permease subunit
MAEALDVLTAPWSEPITRRALVECALLGISGGLLGCWLVLYQLSYSAESLAHGMLPGLVAASLIGLPLLLGAAAGVGTAAGATALAARTPLLDRDTAVAVVVSALLGLGVLLALSPATPTGMGSLLFGDVLGVSDGDLLAAGALVVLLVIALAVLHGRFAAVGFDRQGAAAMGVRPPVADAALLALLAGALLVAVQGLGNLLVVAVLIAPAAAARLMTRRLPAMMAVSAGIAVAGCTGGLYLSYYAATAAGASIAGVLVGVFVLVWATYHVR